VPFSALGTGWYLVSFSDAGYAKPPSMPLDVSQLNYSGGIRVAPNSVSFLVSASPGEQLPLQLTGPGCVSWTDTGTASCGESYSAFSEGDSVSFGSAGISPAYITVSPTPFTNYVCNAQNFNASGAPGTLTYKWTASDGASITTSGSRNESAQITFSNPGTATITVQAGPLSATANGTVIGPTNILHVTVATTPSNTNRTTIGVGEEVSLNLSPGCPCDTTWSDNGLGMIEGAGSSVTYTAPGVGGNETVTAVCCGNTYSVTFSIAEPAGVDHADYISTWGSPNPAYPAGAAGASMYLNVTMAPTSVSFYNVQMEEVCGPASGVSGYFTNFPTAHTTCGFFFPLSSANQWPDQCSAPEGGYPPPFSTGEYDWVIPWTWYVPRWPTTTMPPYIQSFTIDANGTLSVSKFDKTVTRTTNDVITPQVP
jgi:hypothetical protein